MNAVPVLRGCGNRVKGGAYAECGMSQFGSPVEDFLMDPPIIVDAQALGLTAVGVKLIQHEDAWHVFDIVGKEHYPNVADFIEEVRRFGMSRRLPRTLDFSKLNEKSRMVLLHDRAWIENASEYFKDREDRVVDWSQYEGIPVPRPEWSCPKQIYEHVTIKTPPAMCASLWWEDLVDGENEQEYDRFCVRDMPSFKHWGFNRPTSVTPQYKLAIFASFPITRLAVIKGDAGEHEQALENAKAANLQVDLENE